MIFEHIINGKNLKIEAGKFAEQAAGAVTVSYGDTVVLVAVTRNNKPREGIDFFPLSVDYDEKLYAAGRIKGSKWVKREGRPTDEAILSGRLIDRAVRPLFPEEYRNEVQIIATVLSFDGQNDPDILSLVGASTALIISDIPFNGPVAGIRIGFKDGKFVINPNYEDREAGQFDLVVAGFGDVINMLEAGFNQMPEEKILEAVEFAQPILKELVDFQNKIKKEIGQPKLLIEKKEKNQTLVEEVKSFLSDSLDQAFFEKEKTRRISKLEDLKNELFAYLKQKLDSSLLGEANSVWEDELNRVLRENILQKEKRPDGRALDEVREISCETGILPRTHGSGLFKRGNTQVLSVLTLASPGMEQYLDTIEEESGRKRFMHHYNFPGFSVGEVRKTGLTGRREIGHGALAEKALAPLMPSKIDFPYTTRIVSEVLSSNGSSSMASVCGSVLALYDAGVKIIAPAAGIAMGIITNEKGNYKILTDIQGPEDHFGDMDLKVAGTKKGLTALQMDVKIKGINLKILKETLVQARKAREEILEKMLATISEPRPQLSPYAPKIYTLEINLEKIGAVIGPKGKIINEIIAETGATIDIEEDGMVFVTSQSEEAAQKAIEWIKNLTREVKIGEVFIGKVKKIVDFGAFVEILPGTEGLVHISEVAEHRIMAVSDVLKILDMVSVKVKNIDDTGKISLTMRGVK